MPDRLTSIVVCSRDRPADLRRTLASLAGSEPAVGLECELIVVDNSRAGNARAVVAEAILPGVKVRYLHEPRPGLSRARNAGVRDACGAVLLFTDDDIRFPGGWARGMAEPIFGGQADAVAGGVTLAPDLLRPWMNIDHRSALAGTERLHPDRPTTLVGANMAVARHVFDAVGPFDEELGAGALGCGEETLFAWRLRDAGFRLGANLGLCVEHHFDPARLSRRSFLLAAAAQGRSAAYLSYHWNHERIADPVRRLTREVIALAYWRWKKQSECRPAEGIPWWELYAVRDIWFYRQYLTERRRPSKYARRGSAGEDAAVALEEHATIGAA